MAKSLGAFIAYWPCGKCISGAAVDRGSNFDGEVVLDALRAGCPVGYDTSAAPIHIGPCTCSASSAGDKHGE